ncbi:ABC transporter family protein [Clostridium argentinense CDC 2741]|uniref:ABC transporter family protein n=1 Tax=Clostridium argentinense CDC 2741 TaxID=1418104 RepID=A0A0C1UA53_9CLOT|nr:ABC transporter ATP-binding protein [Clostridium argentinense]ARC83779.1 multidrug ABC transporter ATP-binding protein [Clostridium argentinense]KIE44455.1 ABC transporter family protein [Clostridium argentinense CDC 2741]NFF39685.1 ABC transporter ATP-binding protein [Clostridium argentinense]NFP49685.1 ABC transporter ATP-binding protein [Clostridium argentinense]NFP72086.1 ABC transporter ATP-binding protein [Clostridium argentinense]
MVILEANKVKKIYGGDKNTKKTEVLQGIDIKLNKGEFTAIMGPSGSGKTTLLNVLSGMSMPTSGIVNFLGKNLNTFSSDELTKFRRKTMGFIFQDFNLMDSLTLRENVLLPMVLEKRSIKDMEEISKKIIETIGLGKVMDKYPYNVSGGEMQRTAMARALVNNPDIIFADEPTGNLDSKSSNLVMRCFQEINEKNNSTILMVTHDAFAASFCRKVIFIKDGKIYSEIVKKGSKKDFFYEILDFMAVLGG